MIYEIDINENTEQGKKLLKLLAEMNVSISPKNSISKLQEDILIQSESEANNGLLKDHKRVIDEVSAWLNS